MRTPREILLSRHRSTEPKLDRMWTNDLSTELRSKATSGHENVFLATGWTLCRELILPSRRIWAGLACAWVLIAVFNLASSEPTTKVVAQSRPRSSEEIHTLIEQQRMFAQLLGPLAEPTYTQKPASPGPRSECAAQASVT
jgi:hypothetical protein